MTYTSSYTGAEIDDAIGRSAIRAWVNFNGTGTVAIMGSYNVSSVTDNGTGDYTANFSSSISDVNYCALVSAGYNTGTFNFVSSIGAKSTSSVQAKTGTVNPANAAYDADEVGVMVAR